MKSKLLILVSFLVPMMVFAQKNVVPANQITALNLKLPEGSKQDKRFLSTVAAGTLLEAEVMEPTIKLGATEVYMLPSTAKSGFDRNILVKELEKSGFEIIPTDDELISWLVKGPEAFLIYFSMDKEETNFYLARSNAIPNAVSQSSDQNPNLKTPPYIPPLPQARTNTTNPSTQHKPTDLPQSSQDPTVQNTASALFSGFQFTTSNFDDGWVSSIQPDWVLVQKGETKVYLFFVLPYRSENFSGTGVMDRDFYWDNHVAPNFKTTTKTYQDGGEFVSSMQPKYVEGWGQDPQTGQRRFLGMYLTVSPNAAMLTVASTADENSIRQNFPKASDRWTSDLVAMSRYNKFAIGPNDLNGTWQSGGSQMTQWYDSFTGAYARATIASSSATFSFAGQTYSSIHNGATGAVGAMNTFQQEYKGNSTISNWNITLTNRCQGKTHQFDAHFQAVKGGRLLYLNNRVGEEYLLVKIR